MIKFANIDRYGACRSTCGHAPKYYGGFRYDRQLPLHKEVPLLQDEIQDSLLGFCRM